MFTRTLLGVTFLVTVTASIDDPYPTYAVAPETTLTRVWTSTTEMESAPAKMFLDGEEVPAEAHGTMKLRVSDERRLEVVDEVRAVAEGRPTKFERTYGEFSNKGVETVIAQPPGGEAREKENARERSSPLKGLVVRFTWNAKDEEYERAFVAQEGEKAKADEALLEGLAADADWLALLEGGPRAKDESFALPTELFQRVQYPLGELNWQIDGKDADGVTKEINAELAENLDGEGKAKWLGIREVEGRQLGVFSMSAELTSKADAEAEESGEKRQVDLELSYEGEILWDMAAGRLAQYAIEAEVRSVLTSTRRIESPKGKAEVRQVFDLEGTTKHTLVVTAE